MMDEHSTVPHARPGSQSISRSTFQTGGETGLQRCTAVTPANMACRMWLHYRYLPSICNFVGTSDTAPPKVTTLDALMDSQSCESAASRLFRRSSHLTKH